MNIVELNKNAIYRNERLIEDNLECAGIKYRISLVEKLKTITVYGEVEGSCYNIETNTTYHKTVEVSRSEDINLFYLALDYSKDEGISWTREEYLVSSRVKDVSNACRIVKRYLPHLHPDEVSGILECNGFPNEQALNKRLDAILVHGARKGREIPALSKCTVYKYKVK